MNVERVKKRWYSSDLYHCDFREMVDDAVGDGACVLDVGAGAGEVFSYDLKGRVKEMVGVDMDPRVESNPLLHRGIRCSVTSIPVEDKYFDVVFCRYVHDLNSLVCLAQICRAHEPLVHLHEGPKTFAIFHSAGLLQGFSFSLRL